MHRARALALALAACLCCGVLAFSTGWAAAQSPVQRLGEYFRETWTTRDGLPHNLIADVTQSGDGYLWIATWEGMVRFNGRRFEVFDRGQGLPDAGVRAFFVGGDGSLLVGGARGGLGRLRNGQWRGEQPVRGLISSLLEDRRRGVWIGSEGHGLVWRPAGGTERHYGRADGLPGEQVFALAEDAAGQVYVGTDGGLAVHDGSTLRAIGDLSHGRVMALHVGPDGRLLVGTDRGVLVLSQGRLEVYAPELRDVAAHRLLVDRLGSLWVGSTDAGLLRLSEHGLERLTVEQGLPNNRLLSLYEDFEGSLWAGTSSGLFRLRDAPFSSYTRSDGLPDNYVRTVFKDAEGRLWIGTSAGLARWQEGRAVVPGNELDQVAVLSLGQSREGDLLVGTYDSGLLTVRDGVIRGRLSREQGLPSAEVRVLRQARDGALWIGTAQGLVRVVGDRIETLRDGLPSPFVVALHELDDGSLLIGTSAGAARWRPGGLEAIELAAFDGIEFVFDFLRDPADGAIWFATDRGLLRWRAEGKAGLVGRAAGLPVDRVFGVLIDGEQHLWLSSNRGVLRLPRDQAVAVSEGRRDQLVVERYDEADGMASRQCNGSSGPALFLRRDGSAWFATALGVATVKPWRIRSYSAALIPTVIEDVRIDGRSVASRDPVLLQRNHGRLEVEYAGLGLAMPSRIRHRFRLLGDDASEDWTDTEGGVLDLGRPAPGLHLLEVQSAYPYGAWSPQPARLAIDVETRWQEQPIWFAALLLIALSGLAGLSWWLARRGAGARERAQQALLDARSRAHHALRAELAAAQRERASLQALAQRHEAALERARNDDPLTGLLNRLAFTVVLERACGDAEETGESLVLAMIQVDGLAEINRRRAYAAGDRLLVAAAELLRAHHRAGEDRVCRFGAGRFLWLMPETGLTQARALAEGLRQAAQSVEPTAFTLSIGLAWYRDASTADRLLARAETLLATARQEGGDRVVG